MFYGLTSSIGEPVIDPIKSPVELVAYVVDVGVMLERQDQDEEQIDQISDRQCS